MGMPRQKKEKPSYKIKLIGFQLLFHVRSLHVISHDYWTLLFQVNKDAQFPCPSLAVFLQLLHKLILPTAHKVKFLPAKASTRFRS